jgi:hypothetical protein
VLLNSPTSVYSFTNFPGGYTPGPSYKGRPGGDGVWGKEKGVGEGREAERDERGRGRGGAGEGK